MLRDTFGRLQRLTYPDGEVLTYGYDSGGLVNKATGVKGKFSYPYLKRLDYDKFDQRVYLQLGNGVTTSYAYRQDNRRLDTLQAQLPCGRVAAQQRGTHRRTPCGCNVTHYQFQNLGYRYDNVGNILGIANNSLYPKGQQGIGEEVGGPVTQSYVYDDLYRLKEASGEYRHEADELRRYRMSMDYDSIHNIVAKEQLDEEVEKENGKTETEVEHKTSYTYGYHYAAPQTGSNTGSIHPHAPSEIGHYSFQYDSNGNQLERRYRDDEDTRQIVWDEDNRMGCVHEFEHEHPASIIAQVPLNCSSTAEKLNHDGRNILNGSHTPEVRFVYNDRGERVFKESDDNVSFYLNPHYTEKSDDAYKHILIGTTRLVTQEVEKETHEAEDDLYYYHPDHLGSSSFVTDRNGKLEEHLEYFPFGETWIEEESSLPIAFRFTAKELDSETGLYYFGARYYDPRTSVWQSADPILASYIEGKPNGGVYRSENLGLYSYASQNPIKFVDPDGRAGKKFLEVLAKISEKYKNYECDSCAKEMIDAAKKHGESGNLVKVEGNVQTKTGAIWSDKKGGSISKNDNHYGVEVDGKVFDNHTPQGIPKKEFEADLAHPFGLKFEDIEFGAKVGYEKAKNAIKSIALFTVAVGTAASDEAKAAVSDPLGTAFEWSPLSDIRDAFTIKGLGGCDNGVCSDMMNYPKNPPKKTDSE